MTDKIPKVLVMDDEAGIRDILSRMLSARGIDVETAEEGSRSPREVPAGIPGRTPVRCGNS